MKKAATHTSTLIIVIFASIVSMIIFSCSSQNSSGKTVTAQSKFPRIIERAKKDQRYLIMQSGINVYNVTSVDLDKKKQEMTVTLDKVDSSRLANAKNVAENNSQSGKVIDSASSQLYLYMKDSTSYTYDEPHTIPIKNIDRVQFN